MSPTLTSLVARINALDGFTTRYRLVFKAERQRGEPRRCMLVCAEGQLDRRETPWLTPREMVAFLGGYVNGHSTSTRRVARRGIPARW